MSGGILIIMTVGRSAIWLLFELVSSYAALLENTILCSVLARRKVGFCLRRMCVSI